MKRLTFINSPFLSGVCVFLCVISHPAQCADPVPSDNAGRQQERTTPVLFCIGEVGSVGPLVSYRPEKWGLIDIEGATVVNPTYDEIHCEPMQLGGCDIGPAIAQCGRIGVKTDGKWGFIDLSGNMIIQPIYSDARPFIEEWGMAPVKKRGMWGFIDTKGIVRVEFKYAKVRAKSCYDRDFAKIPEIPDSFEIPGLLPPRPFYRAAKHKGGVVRVQKGRFWLYVDREGKECHLGTVYIQYSKLDSSSRKVGLVNKHGQYVIEPEFDGVRPFSEGLAGVKVGEKWGYTDITGKKVIPPQYDIAGYFRDGRSPVKKDDRWGVIDKQGNEIVRPQYSSMGTFSDGLALVAVPEKGSKRGGAGYIDTNGNLVTGIIFSHASPFRFGLATVIMLHSVDGRSPKPMCCYINRRGAVVWPKADLLKLKGEVVEILSPTEFRIQYENAEKTIGKVSLYQVGFRHRRLFQYEERAKNVLSQKILGKKVTVLGFRSQEKAILKFNRAHAYVDRRWINREMVAEGWGLHSYSWGGANSELMVAEMKAEEARLGIWQENWNERKKSKEIWDPPEHRPKPEEFRRKASGKPAVKAALATMIIPEVRFHNASLKDVVAHLRTQAKQLAPKDTEIKFLLRVEGTRRPGPSSSPNNSIPNQNPFLTGMDKTVTLSLKNVSIQDILDRLARIDGVKFTVSGNTVLIHVKARR